MSAAKRTLRRVISSWLKGREPGAPAAAALRDLRREVAGGRSTPRSSASSWTRGCRTAPAPTLLLTDDRGGVQLVIQLDGGSRLPNRVDPRAGLPLVVLRAATLDDRPRALGDAARVRPAGLALPLRRHPLAAPSTTTSRCARSAARSTCATTGPSTSRASSRTAAAAPSSSASATSAPIAAASSCAADSARRRPSAARPRPAPLIELGPRLQIVARIVTASLRSLGHHAGQEDDAEMFDFDVLKISEAPDGESRRSAARVRDERSRSRSAHAAPRRARHRHPARAGAHAVARGRRGDGDRGDAPRARGAAVVVQNHRPVGVVTDRDILTQACADVDDLRAIPIGSIMLPCAEPLRETDTVGSALRSMCARRQWHLPIVCSRGLFLGALDIADISLWLRDRLDLDFRRRRVRRRRRELCSPIGVGSEERHPGAAREGEDGRGDRAARRPRGSFASALKGRRASASVSALLCQVFCASVSPSSSAQRAIRS